jgi:hypothetical protein
MGTSTSYRSPPTPRWKAVQASYRTSASLERTTSELFNAADAEGWQSILQGGATRLYAREILALHDGLPAQFQEAETAARGAQAIIDDARIRALDQFGGDAGVAIAERAFARLLIAMLQTDIPLAQASGAEAARAWSRLRPSSGGPLVARYLSEVLRQLVLHLANRDLPAHVGTTYTSAAEARVLSRRLAERAASLVADDEFPRIDGDEAVIEDTWPEAVARAFSRGRSLLGGAGA